MAGAAEGRDVTEVGLDATTGITDATRVADATEAVGVTGAVGATKVVGTTKAAGWGCIQARTRIHLLQNLFGKRKRGLR